MKKLSLPVILISLIFVACAQTQEKKKEPKTSESMMNLTEKEWKSRLSAEQYYILREKGTERPFTGKLLHNKEKGTYKCAGCGEELFSDDMKFDSHCGWPSFDKEIAGGKIKKNIDLSHGMKRTEITCAKCDGHLGHLFDDGPTETGMRYCVNSLSLTFEKKDEPKSGFPNNEVATFGGGCFWCIEAVFEELVGVKKVESGYSGGTIPNPTYEQVSRGSSGHAEVVQIHFNPQLISFETLLEVFFTVHDPTTLNRQGADVGTQYRSAIFYHNQTQKEKAEKTIQILNQNKVFDSKIVTEVSEFKKFYVAEDYHQEYYRLNKEQPYCRIVIKPKMDKLHKVFNDKIKKHE
ncbi:MAG: bifunctional methionine sulfoxide reductase B/A protein [Cytophagales bacterium]